MSSDLFRVETGLDEVVEVLASAQGLGEPRDDVFRNLGVGVHAATLEPDQQGHLLVVVGRVGDVGRRNDRDLSYHVAMAPPIKPVREYLVKGGGGPITVRDLAQRIEGTVADVKRLIDHQYLTVVMEKADPEQTVVSCPGEEGVKWLRNMVQPIHLVPFIKLDDVHRLIRKQQGRMWWKNAVARTRRVCLTYQIPLFLDPVYGELLTIEGFAALAYHIGVYRNPTRNDRVTMLTFLMNALTEDERTKERYVRLKIPYRGAKRLNLEIARIARLGEPERTFMAQALYECWKDSRAVQECLRKLRDRKKDYRSRKVREVIEEIESLDRKMELMKERGLVLDM